MAKDSSLVISVSAANDMASGLSSAEASLNQLAVAGDKAQQRIEAAMAKSGAVFGPFSKMSDEAVASVKGNFADMERQIEKSRKAIAASLSAGIPIDLGLDDARSKLVALEAQMRSAQILAKAAATQSSGEGQATAATKQYIAATEEARIKMSARVAGQREHVGALERQEIALREVAAAEGIVSKAGAANITQQGRAIVSTGQMRSGSQQLSYQLNDVAVQFAAGTPPMMIFAQQSSQVVQAIGMMTGESKGLLGVLSGPWGMAFTAALVLLSPFISKLIESGEATDQFGNKQKSLTDRILEQNTALRENLRLQGQKVAFDQAEARDTVLASVTKTTNLQKELAWAQEQLRGAKISQGNAVDAVAERAIMVQIALLKREISSLEKQIGDQQKLTDTAGQSVRMANAAASSRSAQAKIDPAFAETRQFEAALALLQDRYINPLKHAQNRRIETLEQLTKAEANLRLAHEANLKTINERQKEQSSRGRFASASGGIDMMFSLAESKQLVRSIAGGGVQFGPSQVRSAKRAADLGASGSHHKWDSRGTGALDFNMAGMKDMSPADLQALAERLRKGGLDVTNIFGPQKHAKKPGDHADHIHIQFRRAKLGKMEVAALDDAVNHAKTKLAQDMAFGQQERDARGRLLGATRQTTASELERDKLLRDDINADADSRKLKLEQQVQAGQITAAQAEILINQEEIVRKERLMNVDAARAAAIAREAVDIQIESIDAQIVMLQFEANMATTIKARRDIELRILELTKQRELQIADAIINDINSSEEQKRAAQRARDRVEAEYPARESEVRNQNKGPVDEYRDRLTRSVGDINEAMGRVQASGLQSLEDGLVGIVTGTESVGAAFKRMANQIIADIARIAIQRLMLGLFGDSEGGLFGGGSGSSGLGGSGMFGDRPGFGTIFLPGREHGGPVSAGQPYIVGEKRPEIFIPKVSGSIYPRVPVGGGGGTMDVNVTARPTRYFELEIDKRSQRSAQAVVGAYDRIASNRMADRMRRYA